MYAHRTVITRIGHACALGCLLVGTPALAVVNSNGIELLSSSSTGVKTGQYIEAAASVRYQHVNTAQRIYTKALVPVASSTLRRGALAALGAGVVHPGFQVALLAAGFILTSDSEVHVPDPTFSQLQDAALLEHESIPEPYKSGGPYVFFGGPTVCQGSTKVFANIASHVMCLRSNSARYYSQSTALEFEPQRYKADNDFGGVWIGYSATTNAVTEPDYVGGEAPTVPATEQDYIDHVDPVIPPQLYDELYNWGNLPLWRDEITVLGAPATYVQPTGDQAVAPEVASKAGRWAENVAAQLDGQPLPNPEEDATGSTAEDKLLEELDLDGPVPPYPNPEVDWQIETLTLPAYSSGIGDGMCPPPASIPLPLGGGTLDWSYQPACDLADMARPAFLGACGLIALLIVLRARGGSD